MKLFDKTINKVLEASETLKLAVSNTAAIAHELHRLGQAVLAIASAVEVHGNAIRQLQDLATKENNTKLITPVPDKKAN